ncbi:amino acid permease [Helicosporidium sp. ATCC 50920]|nr:amino acid permease [Helicosporidium sp. ATCC 50920]|eukprot:KDD75750.1 amino acid permease [Helicosporidium sp. ATCC 50920]
MNWKELASDYWQGIKQTPQLLRRLPFRKRTLEDELSEALLRGNLRKSFTGFDLLMLGIGITMGSGVFSLTGQAIAVQAGPSTLLSYVIAGMATAFAAACYGELCVEYPVAGGAFTYTMVTFGEFAAWITVANYLIEYVCGMALVARYFTLFLADLAHQPSYSFTINVSDSWSVDPLAMGLVFVVSALLCLSVRQNSIVISTVTMAKLAVFSTLIVASFTRATPSNLDPFMPADLGFDGIFRAAGTLVFTLVGFDSISNASEEAHRVSTLPWAMIGTVVISSTFYILLTLGLVLMVPPSMIDTGEAFSHAFSSVGLPAFAYLVAVAAILGILTALLVGLYSLSRVVMVCARDWMLPPPLANISVRFQTPVLAQAVVGIIIGTVALLCPTTYMGDIVSFAQLFNMYVVINAQIVRRYLPGVKLRFTRFGTVEAQAPTRDSRWLKKVRLDLSQRTQRVLVVAHMLAITVSSVGLAVSFRVTNNNLTYERTEEILCLTFAALWLASTLSFQLLCPLEYLPPNFHIKGWLMPWMPSLAIGLIVFSLANLPTATFIKMGVILLISIFFYFVFCLPMSYIKHYKLDFVNTEQMNVVDLVYVNGQWKPSAPHLTASTLSPAVSDASFARFNQSRKGSHAAATYRTSTASNGHGPEASSRLSQDSARAGPAPRQSSDPGTPSETHPDSSAGTRALLPSVAEQ